MLPCARLESWMVTTGKNMPIPPFDGILNVLPPHLGDPRIAADLSPYPCTVAEICERFATNEKRKQILAGFLALRKMLLSLGWKGFQWIDGSFLEDIESQEGREPGDIDVITFVEIPQAPIALIASISSSTPNLLSRDEVKAAYFVDHFWLSLGSRPAVIVDQARHWYGLFSHRRDRVWKGMLLVRLDDPGDDAATDVVLGGKP